MFPSIDDPLLPRRVADGEIIEPEFYLPIIPTVLINGCQAGIGTGWSCSIPLYNPRDLVQQCRAWIHGGPEVLTDITPWYRNFKGTITKVGTKFITKGLIKRQGSKVTVTELPIGLWTDKFKEFLEDLLEQKMIKGMKNYSTPQKVRFEITECPNGVRCTIENLKMTTSLSTSNMVLFIGSGKLRKFNDVTEIIDLFCRFRKKLYEKRKGYLVEHYKKLLSLASNKYKFLVSVMDDELVISRRSESDIVTNLIELNFDKLAVNSKRPSFEYLLSMDMRSFTQEKLEKLRNEIGKHEASLAQTESQTVESFWEQDLAKFEKGYDAWEEKMKT